MVYLLRHRTYHAKTLNLFCVMEGDSMIIIELCNKHKKQSDYKMK